MRALGYKLYEIVCLWDFIFTFMYSQAICLHNTNIFHDIHMHAGVVFFRQRLERKLLQTAVHILVTGMAHQEKMNLTPYEFT